MSREIATPVNQSFANQHKMRIHKRKWERYAMIGIDELRQAAQELKPGSLKLYLYLIENVDSYEFWLSPSDVQQTYGISKSTYDRGLAELIEKGYVVRDGNLIHFYANKDDRRPPLSSIKKSVNELFKKASLNCSQEQINNFRKRVSIIKELKTEKEQYDELRKIELELKNLLTEKIGNLIDF